MKHATQITLAVLFLFSESLYANDTQKLNVLFIISDDLTAEALSCYGNE